MNLVLANHDYRRHMTDEGLQLQQGLEYAGWKLVGAGYKDNCRSIPMILDAHKPQAVFVQDKRDWDPHSGVCTGGDAYQFHHLDALASYPGFVAVPVKDAGPDGSEYHEAFCREVGAKAVVLYYHQLSCLKYCPWLTQYRLVRTYHSINPQDLPDFVPGDQRRPALGSGAVMGDTYPIRTRVCTHPQDFGLMWLKHPGYANRGVHTPRYLEFISQFKVHLATSSSYGFALRKIIESVACGCTPITDLPSYDVLPEIDRALVRIKPRISDNDLRLTIAKAVTDWDEDGRLKWAQKAIDYYNYACMGVRLSYDLIGD